MVTCTPGAGVAPSGEVQSARGTPCAVRSDTHSGCGLSGYGGLGHGDKTDQPYPALVRNAPNPAHATSQQHLTFATPPNQSTKTSTRWRSLQTQECAASRCRVVGSTLWHLLMMAPCGAGAMASLAAWATGAPTSPCQPSWRSWRMCRAAKSLPASPFPPLCRALESCTCGARTTKASLAWVPT